MRELLGKYGLTKRLTLEAAERKSEKQPQFTPFVFPATIHRGVTGKPMYQPRLLRRRKRDLILFSESPMPARAIRMVRNAITSLTWGLQAKSVQDAKGKEDKIKEAVKQVKMVLDRPNTTDDDFASFLGQIVEDIMIFDAGCWEYVEKPKYIYGNELLALEVVPGFSIAQNRKWSGDPKMPRWVQVLDDGRIHSQFLDTEIEYVMQRKRSFDPFGLSPLETALEIMDSLTNLSAYQREIASNAYPSELIYLGDEAEDDAVKTFRMYWENELKGRGTPGFFGGMGRVRPQSVPLKPTADSGLFLEYFDLLTRVLAISFDLHPQDFGLERDVNRSTADVSMSATLREGVKPLAKTLKTKINTHVLPRIAELSGNKTITELEFFWTDIDPKDEQRQAQVDQSYGGQDAITIDEMRSNLDLDPLPNDLGKMTPTGLRNLLVMDPLVMMRSPKQIKELLEPPSPDEMAGDQFGFGGTPEEQKDLKQEESQKEKVNPLAEVG